MVSMMDNVTYKPSELCREMINDVKKGFSSTAVVIGDKVVELMFDLMYSGKKATIIDYNTCDYCGEYYVTVFDDELYCNPAWHKENEYHKAGYLLKESDINYIQNDCNSQILPNVLGSKVFFDFS